MPVSIQHQRSANRALRIVCPNGHLGFAPIKTGSYEIGAGSEPDLICADSGSCDIGPGPLGSDISSSPLAWQTHDLEQMLLGARRLGMPMIIGSAGDTGTNSRVDLFVEIIKDLARKHALAEIPCRLVPFRSAQIGTRTAHRARRDHRRPGRSAGARPRHARGHRPHRCHGRRASLHQAAGRRRRRDHRRPQQRLRDLRRARDPRRLSRGARLLLRQDPRMRLVLRRTLRAARSRSSARSPWTTSK